MPIKNSNLLVSLDRGLIGSIIIFTICIFLCVKRINILCKAVILWSHTLRERKLSTNPTTRSTVQWRQDLPFSTNPWTTRAEIVSIFLFNVAAVRGGTQVESSLVRFQSSPCPFFQQTDFIVICSMKKLTLFRASFLTANGYGPRWCLNDV